jgi:CRISPR-associated protein Csb2
VSEEAIVYDETGIDPSREQPAGTLRPGWLGQAVLGISATLPTTARFALIAAILPPLEYALAVGDRVRMALLRCSDGHPVFLGRDPAGRVARGQRHDHAWFLPADDDADGSLDHVVVHARAGFDRAALQALSQLRRVWGHGGSDLELRLVDLGSPHELGCLRRDALRREAASQLGTARVWESLTPFVPPRHIKVRASGVRDAPQEQVVRLLALHGFPAAQVEALAAGDVTPPRPLAAIDWHRFRRIRTSGGGCRGANAAFGFRLRFERAVTGPIALGYAAHQGLGQFVAVE